MAVLLAAGERVPVDGRIVEGRSEIDGSLVVRRKRAAAGRGRRRAAGRHAQPHRAADHRGDRRGRSELVPGRDDAPDGGGRGRRARLSPHRRPRRAALCAGDPRHRLRDLRRLDGRDRRRASRRHRRHRRPDHHLPLRARACRADGPGGRGAPPVRARHHGQGRRRAGAPGRGRPCRLRQDRHAHQRRAAAGRCRRHRSRQPGGRRRDGGALASSLFAGHRRRGPAPARAGGRAGRHRRASRGRPRGAGRRQGLSPRPAGLGAARRTRTVARESCCPRTGGCCAASPSRTGCGPARARPSPR